MGVSVSTAKRSLDSLVATGLVERIGRSRATLYRRAGTSLRNDAAPLGISPPSRLTPPWSDRPLALLAILDQALVPEDDRAAFAAMLGEELRALTGFNFARYRLTFAAFSACAGQGRPA